MSSKGKQGGPTDVKSWACLDEMVLDWMLEGVKRL